jgi:peptidyl-prolyl cis-trans isomerase SurA
MTVKFLTALSIVCLLPVLLAGQKNDPVLFTVHKTPVHVSEFSYIYAKTNGQNADFSRKSLEEYLDLYVKFKLKVQKARDMQIDTVPSLKSELDGYRRQLADSYLVDREVTEKLAKEAYDRIQQDVELYHIFFAAPRSAAPADTLAQYERAMMVKRKIETGAPFAEMAREHSDDKSALTNGGQVGYITAIFPPGMYELEKAAYTLPLNKLTGPIRTGGGYHLVKIGGRRPARGEIEVAHILIRRENEADTEAKNRIDSIYSALEVGADFEEMAIQFSDDKNSGQRGGYIGFFGINRYEPSFENAAFALKNDGEYSRPFESTAGWHIVRRISKRDIQSFSVEKSRLEARIKNDDRFEEARRAMIENIRKQNNFTENHEALHRFAETLDESFLTFRWKPAVEKDQSVLFTLGKEFKATVADFEEYLSQSARKRLRYSGSMEPAPVAEILYADFVDESCLKFEEMHLYEKYPEFKALMREYEEGILLFEATNMQVWSKASLDSAGLEQFFNDKLKGKYRWEERAVVQHWRLQPEGKEQLGDIMKAMGRTQAEKLLERFNTGGKELLSFEERTYEKSKAPAGLQGERWKTGALTTASEDPKTKEWTFLKLNKIIPPADKTLKEARGYIVSDYQDHLEAKWVEELRKEYKVTIHREVLDRLIKS